MRYLFILSFFIVSGCDVNREVTPITQIPDFTQPADFPIPDSPMDTTVPDLVPPDTFSTTVHWQPPQVPPRSHLNITTVDGGIPPDMVQPDMPCKSG